MTILFDARHDNGFGEWIEGQHKPNEPGLGFSYPTGNTTLEIAADGSNNVLRAAITTNGQDQAVRAFRRTLPDGSLIQGPLWYSFWAKFPRQIVDDDNVAGSPIGLMQFKGRASDSSTPSQPMWSMNFTDDTFDGKPVQRWWWWTKKIGSASGHHSPDDVADKILPVGEWFHVEVYFKPSKGGDGQFEIWTNGTHRYGHNGQTVRTDVPDDFKIHAGLVYLRSHGVVGNEMEVLYDNFKISTERLGPIDKPGEVIPPPPPPSDDLEARVASLESSLALAEQNIAQQRLDFENSQRTDNIWLNELQKAVDDHDGRINAATAVASGANSNALSANARITDISEAAKP